MIPQPPCRDFHNVKLEASPLGWKRPDAQASAHEASGVRLARSSGLPRG
jgi:hypothetical protein